MHKTNNILLTDASFIPLQDPDETLTATASSTLTASEIGEPVEDPQLEVAQQPPVDIGPGLRITVDTVELAKAQVSA